MTTASEFMTLTELAIAAGGVPNDAESYLDDIVNNTLEPVNPYAIKDGQVVRISRSDLVHKFYYDRRGDVRVRRSDVEAYIEARDIEAALEAEAAKYTTSDRLTWSDPEDRDRWSKGHPVYTADGRPAFERFTSAHHVASWLATGGSLIDDDIDAEINRKLAALMDGETK